MIETPDIALRLHSGVPVLDVCGEWASSMADAVVETIQALAAAGHLEIIVNLERAKSVGAGVTQALAPLAEWIRTRHGHIELVATAEQLKSMVSQAALGQLRWAASESLAMSHIKGEPVRSEGQNCTAHVVANPAAG